MSLALEKIKADLGRHRKAFDLVEGDLGRRLCRAFTDGVQGCIAGEHDPDGNRWPELSERYAEWKAFHYPGHAMGLKDGAMANPREVAGEVTPPTPGRAVATYGVTDQARREAAWFQEGDPSAGRPPRPFWGFTRDSLAEVAKILDDRFKQAVG